MNTSAGGIIGAVITTTLKTHFSALFLKNQVSWKDLFLRPVFFFQKAIFSLLNYYSWKTKKLIEHASSFKHVELYISARQDFKRFNSIESSFHQFLTLIASLIIIEIVSFDWSAANKSVFVCKWIIEKHLTVLFTVSSLDIIPHLNCIYLIRTSVLV